MTLHVVTFTADGTWTVPEGVTSFNVTTIAGGGIGSASLTTGGGGGGGGGCAVATQAASEGQVWDVHVGLGGDTPDENGGNSWVQNGATVAGLSNGGIAAITASGAGGAGGAGSGGRNGGTGGTGVSGVAGGGGGGAGTGGAGGNGSTPTGGTGTATGGGNGGNGGGIGEPGNNGSVRGGGGGGRGAGVSGALGQGANGYVIIEYQQAFQRPLTVTGSGVATMARASSLFRVMAATAVVTAFMAEGLIFSRVLSAMGAGVASMVKQVGMAASAVATGTATLALLSVITRTLSAVATGTASLLKQVQKPLTAVATGTATIGKALAKSIMAVATGIAGIIKRIFKSLIAAATGTPTMDNVETISNGSWRLDGIDLDTDTVKVIVEPGPTAGKSVRKQTANRLHGLPIQHGLGEDLTKWSIKFRFIGPAPARYTALKALKDAFLSVDPITLQAPDAPNELYFNDASKTLTLSFDSASTEYSYGVGEVGVAINATEVE